MENRTSVAFVKNREALREIRVDYNEKVAHVLYDFNGYKITFSNNEELKDLLSIVLMGRTYQVEKHYTVVEKDNTTIQKTYKEIYRFN